MDLSMLPPRMIAAGQKPFGHRVNVYQRMAIIQELKESLSETEIDFIRNSSLGSLLALPNKPACSGGFGLFLMSRQLEVDKENEMWVLFAGTPIRFSLREFKIVTGLHCGKYPDSGKKGRQTKKSKDELYYSKLFGEEENVTIERMLMLLKRRPTTDRDIRLRYACLALVDGILLPTKHFPKLKVVKDHAELVENLEEFLAFPWGRLSFDRIMDSIKERAIAQLATSDVAVQCLFLALQLVVLEAVPSILPENGGDEAEIDAEDDFARREPSPRQFKLSHIRELDASPDVEVTSIIRPDLTFDPADEDLSWTDDEEDLRVENMVNLITEGFNFKSEMFVGGRKPSELVGLSAMRRSDTAKVGRGKKGKTTIRQPACVRKKSLSEPDIIGNNDAAIGSLVSASMKILEGNIAQIVAGKIAENNKIIIAELTKWLKGKSILEEVDLASPSIRIPPNTQSNRDTVTLSQDQDGAGNPNALTTEENGPTVEEVASFYNEQFFQENNLVGSGGDDPDSRNDPPTFAENGGNGSHGEFCARHGDDGDKEAGGVVTEELAENTEGEDQGNDGEENNVEGNGDDDGNAGGYRHHEKCDDKDDNALAEDRDDAVTKEDEVNEGQEIENVDDADKVVPQKEVNVEKLKPDGEEQMNEGDEEEEVDDVDKVVREKEDDVQKLNPDEECVVPATRILRDTAVGSEIRKSKRTRTASSLLDERFDCGKRIKTLTGQKTAEELENSRRLEKRFIAAINSLKSAKVGPCSIPPREIHELIARAKTPSAKAMDGLCKLTRRMLRADERDGKKLRVEVMDSKFVSQLGRLYPKFSKSANKDEYHFSQIVVDMVLGVRDTDRVQLFEEADVIYVPFNFNKIHWVALVVDLLLWKIDVLDCHVNSLTLSNIQETITPLASMLLFLFKQAAGNPIMGDVSLTPFSIQRVTTLPQATTAADSCVMSLLYIQAHGIGSIQECTMVDPNSLDEEIKKMVTCLIENFLP